MPKKDSNIAAKIRKVKQYDIAARRDSTCADIIAADSAAKRFGGKRIDDRRFEFVLIDGTSVYCGTYSARDEMRERLGSRIVYVRDHSALRNDELPTYVVKLTSGEYLRYYNEGNAAVRFCKADAVQIMWFPSLKVGIK